MSYQWNDKIISAIYVVRNITIALRDLSELESSRKLAQQRLQFILEENGKVEQQIADNTERLNNLMARVEQATKESKAN